ncbi:MAG: HD domain-containing protein [Deltaproteobacteria bacterium]|nr:HD domain-containing protein [Deltaproteobacteria bacterium]
MDIGALRAAEERARLVHPLACPSAATRGRAVPEPDDGIRTCFERDAHRILHARPFRRLRRKTQVFFSPENDHVTTRMDHSLYVATIASTICRALGLNDDLAFAVALGHDLGHAPFGHSGERLLAGLLARELPPEAAEDPYTHEAQSLRVVDLLARMAGRTNPGLNLTYEVRDGIRCHCGESTEAAIRPRDPLDARDPATFLGRGTLPITLEGCVVRMADRIAYLGRDYEDAQLAAGLDLPPLPRAIRTVLGTDNRDVINVLVRDLVAVNQAHPDTIGFSDEIHEAAMALRAFNYAHIYLHPRLEAYHAQADAILVRIFEVSLAWLRARPQDRWATADPAAPEHFASLAHFIGGVGYPDPPDPVRVVCDWISLMSDGWAFRMFHSIALPHPLV